MVGTDNIESKGAPNKKKRKTIRRNNIFQLLMVLIILVLLNVIVSFISFRIDLTAEGRYTLTDKTIELAEGLHDVVFFKIYLEGDLPYSFQRLQKSTRELIEELREYAGDNIGFEFVNPSEDSDEKNRRQQYEKLAKMGLDPINLNQKDDEGAVSQKIVFPGAIVSYQGNTLALNLLKSGQGMTPDQALNSSIQDLEYEISSAIKRVTAKDLIQVGLITGHKELDEYEIGDLTNSLAKFYDMIRIKLSGHLNNIYELDNFGALIIAKPDTTFSEQDKFIIDQYIMNGGKVLWLLDFMKADNKKLTGRSELSVYDPNGLDDQLYTYGARINPNLVMDEVCAKIPVPGQLVGSNKPELAPWYYHPLVISTGNHPINKNIDVIKLEYPAYIDTVGLDPKVKKTILLQTGKYTKVVNSPARYSLDIVLSKPDRRQYNRKHLPVAVLLEGEFQSNFRNKSPELLQQISEIEGIKFRDNSVPTKMIVVSDGDIARNKVVKGRGKSYPDPLGQDEWVPGIVYGGNKQFLLNAINYLVDDDGLMSVRARELKLRMLDKSKIDEDRLKWQLINAIVPVVFIILFGLVMGFIRRRKYAK